jgi:hypothetical protein
MNYAFLCHAPEDLAAARELGEWLESHCPCEIRYAECGEGAPGDLFEAAEQAQAAVATILLLSPASVPKAWVRSRWEPLLFDQPAAAGTGMAFVKLRRCNFPELFTRRDYFELAADGRRRLKRWLLAQFPQFSKLPGPVGAAPPAAIEDLTRRLADEAGVAVAVPVDVALAFATAAASDFEGVIWLDCTRRSAAALVGDIAAAAALTVPGSIEANEEAVRAFCAARRLLLVLDQCEVPPFPRTGRTSVLLTAPHPVTPPRPFDEIAGIFAAWSRDEQACLDALRDLLPALYSGPDWPAVRSLGRSAIALLRRRRERAGELHELLDWLIDVAHEQDDPAGAWEFSNELRWIGTDEEQILIAPPAPGEQMSLF